MSGKVLRGYSAYDQEVSGNNVVCGEEGTRRVAERELGLRRLGRSERRCHDTARAGVLTFPTIIMFPSTAHHDHS